MAYDDALFQLGMDLTRSSTAQKEDHGSSADVAHLDRNSFTSERDGVRSASTHLVVDLHGARRLDDEKHIERTLRQCVEALGSTALHVHLHRISPTGQAFGVAVMTGGHASIRTLPKSGLAVVDIVADEDFSRAEIVQQLRDAFEAAHVTVSDQGLPRREDIAQAVVAGATRKGTVRHLKPRVRRAA